MESKIKTPSKNESRIIKFMILLGIFSIINFLFFFFQPEHTGDPLIFALLTVTILYSVLKKLYMWYNYSNISVPEQPQGIPNFKVDILTTYFPGEPYQMVITTLDAINNITYPHTTYLCDEANDPYLKRFCQENGIVHVTRNNRINAKAGNINNALYSVADGEICVVLDPDHIPEPNFLDPILPHFQDPEIGFVQIVQSYYNIKETLVARGAAEQTFQFYGPMMMTLNAYGAVNAIGANCVFRRTALDSIGGHAPGLCEDMHTSMLLYAKGWKAVYIPEVLARGLAPSNLTNFFKQQLKWSRGSFDLWINVYPKIFRKLTGRQKIHYGILPMHYLAGVISLINFLIPIISLVFSATPWEGNVIDFFLVLIPVVASSLLIRTFIQKWVIEKKERGFHLVGGLLHINTWWIYLVGFFYSLIGKKVPYLPTPKKDEWNTNLKIVTPNIAIAVLSILAINYGLSNDLTPFSLVMAGFAFFNACIMLFGVYLAVRVTNQNKILRSRLHKYEISLLYNMKQKGYNLANFAFIYTRRIALPLLLLVLILSMSVKNENDLSKWEQVEMKYFDKVTNPLLGIFHPTGEEGLPDMEEITFLENSHNINFDIISLYLAWNKESISEFPHDIIGTIYEKNSYPMITWEPWASPLIKKDSVKELMEEKKVFKYISEGYYDTYIKEFIQILDAYDKPVFLRFAHEFDNPQYPWSRKGGNTPEEFQAAWKHINHLIKEENAYKVMMVWNPWKPEKMKDYYPGDEYVDWVSLTMLNYGPLNDDGEHYSFETLYEEFRLELNSFTRKPVMIAEFGSVKLGGKQDEWLTKALESLREKKYEAVSALVLFNSAFDKNIPLNDWYDNKFIDWSTTSLHLFKNFSEKKPVESGSFLPLSNKSDYSGTISITRHNIQGVRYKKGEDWRNNYYVLNKDELEKDFKAITAAGFNTIQFYGGNIYDYNLLTYSEKLGLKVIYEFGIDPTIDFINDFQRLKDEKEKIAEKVEDLQQNNNIIGYSFNFNLKEVYWKPLLFRQRNIYINWLGNVLDDLRAIDPETPVTVDLPLNSNTIETISEIESKLKLNSYGLIVNDTTGLSSVLNFGKKRNITIFISSLNSSIFKEDPEKFESIDFVLDNWQDQRKSNWITFDGLVDFEGRPKMELMKISNLLNGKKNHRIKSIKPGILKPAVLLYPGQPATYHARIFFNNQWQKPSTTEGKFNFYWYLIKTDDFGNKLAIKEVGSGPEVTLEIPENYKNHKLLLVTETAEGFVTSTISDLHTPVPR